MATQDPTAVPVRPPWSVVLEDSVAGTSTVNDGNTGLIEAIKGLRAQLAAEFRALKLTLLTGQFQDTQ